MKGNLFELGRFSGLEFVREVVIPYERDPRIALHGHGPPDELVQELRAKARAHDLGLSEEEGSDEDDGKVETSATDRGQATPAARDSDEESAI